MPEPMVWDEVGRMPLERFVRLAAQLVPAAEREHEPIQGGHGHACPRCAGTGQVRVVGQPGYAQRPCRTCGGTGLLRTSSR